MTTTPSTIPAPAPSYLGDLRNPKSRITLERAAGLADCAVANGRAQRREDGAFRPGSDMRSRLDRLQVRSVLELAEHEARELDAWLSRDVAEE